MTLKHLRSSTADKRPQASGMADGQLAINTASGSPGLFFKDTNGSIIKIGPVHVGSGAPNANPASGGTTGNSLGEQWLDTSNGNYVFKIWDGGAWRSESGEFVNVSGDTMTGPLVLGSGSALHFEGATDDGFETILTVVDPTADRTITLPNVTGTVITTGDTGTVTSTMLLDGTIVNGDINASAAIVDTKLATISTADKVSLSALNIDGASDIGAALADVDLFIVDDGGGGTNRKAAASRISDYTFNKVSGDITVTSSGVATIAAGAITNAKVSASAGIVDTKLATITTAGKVANSATTATSSNTPSGIVARDGSGNFTAGTITASGFSGPGTSLTSLPAGQLTGTIPSGVLGNSSLFVGTTSVALNRASANQGLTGITSIALPGATSGTITVTPASVAGTTAITIPATNGTIITTGDSGTVTSTMIADGTIVNADINAAAAIAGTKISPSFGSQDITTSGNLTLQAQGDLRLGDADSSNYVGFQAPTTVAANIIWTLPSASGTANQVLSTDGASNLSWTTPFSASTANTFTALQTFSSGITLSNANITNIKNATFNSQVSLVGTSGTINIDWSAAQNQRQPEPTGTITYTFTAPAGPCHLQLLIDSDGTSTAQTVNWPGTVTFLGSTWTGTNNKKAFINLWYDGTNYFAIGTNQV